MDIDLWEISEINQIEWREEMVNIVIITKEIKITTEETIIKWGKERGQEMIIILAQFQITDPSLIDLTQDPKTKIIKVETNIRAEITRENMKGEGKLSQIYYNWIVY